MSNAAKNSKFFDDWTNYEDLVAELDTYRNINRVLKDELSGQILDIGNGGVINYPLGKDDYVSVVDIAPAVGERLKGLEQVSFREGDAVNLPFESNRFDSSLMQQLIHHLAERSIQETRRRAEQAISEVYRVLKPGGKIVIVESCLPKWCERAELMCFPVFHRAVSLIGHPIVFQWNWDSLAAMLDGAGFHDVRKERIPLGKWVIQLGVKWPTALTPIQEYKFTAYK